MTKKKQPASSGCFSMEKSKWHIVNDKNIFYNKHKDSLSKPLPLPGPREAAFNHEGGNSYEKEKHFESPCGQHAAGGGGA